jgi:hypothetical protein
MKSPTPATATHTGQSGQQSSLPHERDQSGGSEQNAGVQPGSRDIIQKAHDDIENGQEDTDMHDQRTIEKTQRKA